MLQLKDISIAHGAATPLFSGLSFSIAAGSMALLQGPSGSGKSTLLAVISGTADRRVRHQGEILLDDVSLTELPAEKRRVGIMFQDPLLFPHMSVADNLAFGLVAGKRHQRRQQVEEALGIAGLEGMAERDPATLSGGQAARLALMRCLLAEPQALLMDEAFSALDPTLRRSFGGFVRDLIQHRQIPALLVSHDSGDADFADGGIISL